MSSNSQNSPNPCGGDENPTAACQGLRRQNNRFVIGQPFTLEPFTTIEGDQSLRQFPSELKTELHNYIQQPGAKISTFASTSKHKGSVNTTMDDRPACFVEMGTTNRLDVARYSCGPVLNRREMFVVKSQNGSKFNDGKPAIITYYGKGRSFHDRDVISRWAIWTPTGIKANLAVERMALDDKTRPLENSTECEPVKRRRYTKRSDNTPRFVMSQSPPPGEDFGTECQGANDNPSSPSANSNLRVIKQEPGIEQDETTTTGYGSISGDTQDLISINATSIGATGVISLPLQHSQRLDRQLPPNNVDADQTTDIGQTSTNEVRFSKSLNDRSNSRSQSAVYDTSANQTMFHFKMTHTHEPAIKKSLTQCDSVRKLFAYAYKAGISGPLITMLSVSLGDQVVDVIRDDDEDFEEVLRMIRGKRVSIGSDAPITVLVIPSHF